MNTVFVIKGIPVTMEPDPGNGNGCDACHFTDKGCVSSQDERLAGVDGCWEGEYVYKAVATA